ncbi:hypothetical protein Ddye_012614 [Dipteronia dyeriana]|uniref:Uncharacterized protein n=1 Tax=Dipteronia dyeriana TaxID=168575 RepID=A0AAD9X4M3_9ROSI|nr:hypothetical protein Ddye_012614 [Dipteronia dyeriana]
MGRAEELSQAHIYTQLYFGLGPQVLYLSPFLFRPQHNPQRRQAEPEHKMIKYMKPLKLFQETLKRTIDI